MSKSSGFAGITNPLLRLLAALAAACWLAAAPACAAEEMRETPSVAHAIHRTTTGSTLKATRPARHPDYKEQADPLAEARNALRRTEIHEPFREHSSGHPPHFSFDSAGRVNPRLDASIPASGTQCHRHSRAPPPTA